MANYTRQISRKEINEHPEDSTLLAYLRRQELENRSSVIQHIEIEKCPVCLQKLDELNQVCATLDVLGGMRSYQYYPELSVAGTYARMQSAVNHSIPAKTAMNGVLDRQRPRKSAMRLISVPVAFGLAILFTMAILVFANLSGRSTNPFSPAGGTRSGQNSLTIVVPPHSTATPEASVTGTAISTSGRSSDVKGPHIKVCSTKADIAQLQLVICGFHFDSMHKAALVIFVPGKKPILDQNMTVDKRGFFQIGWNIGDCGNIPIFIYGFEETSSKPIIVKLSINNFGSCPVPSISPIVKKFGF